ncbi:unnamed protein product [Penicillium bialowiezense]
MGFSANRSRLSISVPHSRLQLAACAHARGLWQCTRNSKDEQTKPLPRGSDKRHRKPAASTKSKLEWHHEESFHNQRPSSWRWEIWRTRSNFAGLTSGHGSSNRHRDLEKRLASLRKLIEADPYSAVFGRRLEPWHKWGKVDIPWNGFLQSFSKPQQPPKTRVTNEAQCQINTNHTGLQYDPISGRMVPVTPTACQSLDGVNPARQTNTDHSSDNEGKLASPGSVEHWQKPNTSNTNFETHTSTVPKFPSEDAESARTETKTPNETANTSGSHTDRFSEYELEDSTSGYTKETELQSIVPSPENSTMKPNSFVDLTPGANREYPPGNELEAKFATDNDSCFDKTVSSKPSSQQPDDAISVNELCPPDNEVEARSSIELARTDVEQPGCPGTGSETQPSSQRIIDCSPGSEIEAQILSQSSEREKGQSPIQTPIDCPPGSELEANFIANPPSKDEEIPGISQPPVVAPTSNVSIDCSPGSEIEAMFVADSANIKQHSPKTDLGTISSSTTKEQDCRSNLESPEARVCDLTAQKQTPVLESEATSSIFQQPLPTFYILTFDPSNSQVTSAKADSFFGIKENTSPYEVLPQLDNPAKFLPYFEDMEKHGYGIAAGGGDILVFRKTHVAPPSPEKIEQNSPIQAANHIRHDPAGSNPAPSDSKPAGQSISEPLSAAESANLESEPFTKPGSPFGTAIRRMFFAGAATALTCYAIGAMTEFFRTGGQDGRGADGFTVFESDRRRE